MHHPLMHLQHMGCILGQGNWHVATSNELALLVHPATALASIRYCELVLSADLWLHLVVLSCGLLGVLLHANFIPHRVDNLFYLVARTIPVLTH